MDKKREHIFQLLPKVELHAHLNGSISEATMEQLLKMKGQSAVSDQHLMFKKGETGDLNEVFKMFRLIHNITDTEDAIYKAVYDVIHDFAADNVKYLELRTTPRDEPATGMTRVAYVETVLQAMKDCKNEDLDITVRLILAIDRRRDLTVAMETVELAVKYREISEGVIVGLDLSGDPNVGNAEMFMPAFQLAKKKGLKLALHLAEVPAPEETMAVLQVLPDRIGHGTCLQPETGGSKELVQFTLDHKIPLELCLTSNIINMTVPGYDSHHFKFWYDQNHPCVICTDDKGVFSTSLSEEYSLAADTFDLSYDKVWELSYRAIDSAFCEENVKQSLRQKWEIMKNQFMDLVDAGKTE